MARQGRALGKKAPHTELPKDLFNFLSVAPIFTSGVSMPCLHTTLEATQGHILSQSLADATSERWHLYRS